MTGIRFLADESCDFLIVRKLRSAEYDVLSVAESFPSASDKQVLEHAIEKGRILLTGEEIISLVDDHGNELNKFFAVLEPGRARLRKI